MSAAPTLAGRRRFLKGAGAAGLGLIVGFHFDPRTIAGKAALAQAPAADGFVPNAFIHITSDDFVTILCKHIEFGQGPFTGFATIIADELDANWEQIRVEHAPADVSKYANLAFKMQGTGGSTAMANSWDQLRHAGAEARARLLLAAAAEWNVPVGEVTIERGYFKHPAGNAATFGAFCERAATIELKEPAKPKTPDRWIYIGKTFPRVDTRAKTTGDAVFTIDVKLPDMLTCVIARPPRFGGKVKSFDAGAAQGVRGVAEVFAVPSGVAVLGKGYWQARKGADALKVEWDDSAAEMRSSGDLIEQYRSRVQSVGLVARNDGDAEKALGQAGKLIEATYVFPYLAHAPMEPNDCVIHQTEGGVELIFGSQLQTLDQMKAAEVLGLKPEQVAIKTVFAGGSFGRRATPDADMAVEAAEVMKAAKHKGPIKIVWSREDDIRGGRYRPIFVHRLRGAIGPDGNIAVWDQTAAGQSFIFGSPFEQAMVKNGLDATMIEGASDMPYAIPSLRVSVHREEAGVPILWWRSVGHTHTAYAVETFLDQLAAAAKVDELELRRKLLANEPRHLGVLDLVAEKSGYGSPAPEGRARGIAVHKSFGSFVAQVAEVSRGEEGLPKVEKVWCAVDCGLPVNPDVIAAQMQSGIGYALSAALFGAIDLDGGKVVQSNFDSYRVLRIQEMPEVEVHIVPSAEQPTGVGEPGVPPLAPAVANAWARLTGQRVQELPFTRGIGSG
jgi:isoquinoline 1-oxidoreductase beta subunit